MNKNRHCGLVAIFSMCKSYLNTNRKTTNMKSQSYWHSASPPL